MSNTRKIKNKISANELIPGDIFHPGEFIVEEMEARGIKQVTLAELLGVSKSELSLVVNGKRNITIPLSIKLEKVFGIAAETWMNFQMRYEIDLMRKRISEELKNTKTSAKKKATLKKVLTHA